MLATCQLSLTPLHALIAALYLPHRQQEAEEVKCTTNQDTNSHALRDQQPAGTLLSSFELCNTTSDAGPQPGVFGVSRPALHDRCPVFSGMDQMLPNSMSPEQRQEHLGASHHTSSASLMRLYSNTITPQHHSTGDTLNAAGQVDGEFAGAESTHTEQNLHVGISSQPVVAAATPGPQLTPQMVELTVCMMLV